MCWSVYPLTCGEQWVAQPVCQKPVLEDMDVPAKPKSCQYLDPWNLQNLRASVLQEFGLQTKCHHKECFSWSTFSTWRDASVTKWTLPSHNKERENSQYQKGKYNWHFVWWLTDFAVLKSVHVELIWDRQKLHPKTAPVLLPRKTLWKCLGLFCTSRMDGVMVKHKT